MHVACSLQLKTHRFQKPVKCEQSDNLTTNILKNKLMLHQRPIGQLKMAKMTDIAQENKDSSKYNNLF